MSRFPELDESLGAPEDEHIEFKAARQKFDRGKLTTYCAALANEGGGKIILGVTDKRPRSVVGTRAFQDFDAVKLHLGQALRLRIEVEELPHPEGRVVIFHVPGRPVGLPIPVNGAYYMRSGGALVPMTPDMLRRIFEEAGPDFSAEICPGATLDDLDREMIENFRRRWVMKSGNDSLLQPPVDQLLTDAELLIGGSVTYAALVLFGRRAALTKHLAQSEIILEYRSSRATGPAQKRWEFRAGFFSYYDELWSAINARNDLQHYQDGLFMWDVPTFNEAVIREIVLNAVSHRDYRLAGSVFISQYPRRITAVSPGGLPPGVTPQNIFAKQFPRNRRIAEAFAKCGLVERAGQGMNRIFEECIKESKGRPDFTGTDDYQVSITINCEVTDPRFLRFLERIGRERLAAFSTEDFLVVSVAYDGEVIPENLKARASALAEQGVLERIGRGRGTRFILSRRFHEFLGEVGTYTRRRGLDRDTNKELLVQHVKRRRKKGCQLSELALVLPDVAKRTIQTWLSELREEGRVRCVGRTRGARWFPGERLPAS